MIRFPLLTCTLVSLVATVACSDDAPTQEGTGGASSSGDGGSSASDGGSSSGGGTGGPSSGGSGSGGDGTGGSGSTPSPSLCPENSGSLVLDLSSAVPVEVTGLTNQFAGFGNFEGPVWIDDALYFSNIGGSAAPTPSVIWKLVPGSTPTLFLDNSGSNGLALTPDGKLAAAKHSDGTVSTLDLAAPETATPIATTYESSRFNSPNDLVFSQSGTLYFSDPTWQAPRPNPQADALAYMVKAGVATPVTESLKPENPNGIALSLDETTLYVGGVNGLYAHTLNADGTTQLPGTPITTASLNASTGIDGLGRDCAGNLYVTHHSDKAVIVLDKDNAEIGRIQLSTIGGVTNVAFGGANRTTLFITSLGSTPQIHTVELNVPGYPY